jgi:hypothetical protein
MTHSDLLNFLGLGGKIMKTKMRINEDVEIGEIQYLKDDGTPSKYKTVYTLEDEQQFINDIKDELDNSVSINVVLYEDRHGRPYASRNLIRYAGKHDFDQLVSVTFDPDASEPVCVVL